jgi:hypothetical protein
MFLTGGKGCKIAKQEDLEPGTARPSWPMACGYSWAEEEVYVNGRRSVP